jgi:hypothetical protein
VLNPGVVVEWAVEQAIVDVTKVVSDVIKAVSDVIKAVSDVVVESRAVKVALPLACHSTPAVADTAVVAAAVVVVVVAAVVVAAESTGEHASPYVALSLRLTNTVQTISSCLPIPPSQNVRMR